MRRRDCGHVFRRRSRARLSERALVVSGALSSALATSIVLLSVRAGLAIVFCTENGIDAATIVPILYNGSTRVRNITRAGAIASVSSIGGFGLMIGLPIIGRIARRPRRPSPCRSSPRCYCPSARAACRIPLAACRIPLAACRVPRAAYRWPRTAGRVPRAAGRVPRAAYRWPGAWSE